MKIFPAKEDTPFLPKMDIACGVIIKKGKILITLRHKKDHCGDFWEFPGGKRIAPESLGQCLKRELVEELGIRVEVGRRLKKIGYTYPDRHVSLYFFECRIIDGTPKPWRCQRLEWVWPFELKKYDFPPANESILDILTHIKPF